MRPHEREIERIHVDTITVGPRHRTPSEEAIAKLADSMGGIGLQCPILVRVVEDDDGIGNDVVLVAGATRLAAAKKLGWEKIETIEVSGDPLLAEMIELAENLHRAGLTKEERNEHIRRYAELVQLRKERDAEQRPATAENQARQNVAPEIGYKKPPPQKKGIASTVAEETGVSARTVQRVLNPKPPKAAKLAADPLNDFEAREKQVSRLMSAWNAASPEAREAFLERIDRPVFDRTEAGRSDAPFSRRPH